MSKPSIPQGTRDFSPQEVRRRQYILNSIKSVFECYGFQPIETPSMENMSTLMGKYGDEGDRLIFKILNNGLDNPKNQEKAKAAFENVLTGKNDSNLTERALRYDLTIPFARYVVMHQNDIALPFRRYQMQPVWRADRPQRGRYREFGQCDADVVGSHSLINEAELIAIYREAFNRLKIPGICVKINNRKILAGLAACCKGEDQLTNITVAIDKLDKIGWDSVKKELEERGLTTTQIEFIEKYLAIKSDSNWEAIAQMQVLLQESELAQIGISELKETLQLHEAMVDENWESRLQIDFTLARGLSYYTGFIAEVATDAVKMGSIGGGGRYDDLTSLFGLKNLSGVGVSFGIDRIYDVIEELQLFPQQLQASTRVLFVNIESSAQLQILNYLKAIRSENIAAEFYPDSAKFDKQMKYADKRNIPFVAIVGSSELEENMINLKNMQTGEQQKMTVENCIALLK